MGFVYSLKAGALHRPLTILYKLLSVAAAASAAALISLITAATATAQAGPSRPPRHLVLQITAPPFPVIAPGRPPHKGS